MTDETPTAREFCAALLAAGIDAEPDGEFYAAGILLDGRSWLLTNTVNDGYGTRDAPMTSVELWITSAEDEGAHPLAMLIGCTAAQAMDAIRRAEKGDYSAMEPTDLSLDTVPPRAQRPVEGMLTADGDLAFGVQVRQYLRAVRLANPKTIAPWRTGTCPECGQAPSTDGVDLGPDGTVRHVTIGGAVVLGCLGYHVVNPAAVGLEAGSWQDWRDQGEPPSPALPGGE
jgi:hypothetical protein